MKCLEVNPGPEGVSQPAAELSLETIQLADKTVIAGVSYIIDAIHQNSPEKQQGKPDNHLKGTS